MEQYLLDFKNSITFNDEDYIVTNSNRNAVAWVDKWPRWGEGIYSNIVCVFGEESSGKTHLSQIWAKKSGAVLVSKKDISDAQYMDDSRTAYILEDLESFLSHEVQLFYFVNHIINSKKFLFITSNASISKIPFCLEDLKSRLESVLAIEIKKPDESMIGQILVKYFSDRQIAVTPSVIKYLVVRVDFSYKEILRVVDKLDKASLVAKTNISIPFIKSILGL
ncbi:MAG: hypothetical protein K0T99_02785 [Alphaproteobacteria bacterium]|nr:hypothetical protein [Alphaproteobacteria bacterium]